MPPQRHTIKQQILELQVSSNLSAFELQNKISALYRSKIIPLIQTYCDRISNPDTLLRIDTLDIDLGEIELKTLEKDFVARVEEHLSQQLAEKLGPKAAPQTVDGSPGNRALVASPTADTKPQPPSNPTTAQLELLSYFIRSGLLPWWSESLSQPALEDCFDQLLRTSPAALKTQLQTQIKYAKVLQRLIYQFSDRILLDMVTLLAPTGSQWVQSYTQDIQALAPQVKSLQGIAPRQLRLKLWQGIFSQLSLSPTTRSSAEVLIRSSLLQLAHSFQVKVRPLFQQMLNALERLRTEGIRFDSELPAVLAQTGEPKAAEAGTAIARFQAASENLVGLLSEFNPPGSEQTISPSLQANIDALLRQLNALSPKTLPPDQLLTEIAALVAELEGGEAPPAYRQLAQQIKAVVQSIRLPTRPPEAPALPEPFNDPVDPFSESEVIYVQNAGLILLWPFLTRFFATLNLLQANQFIAPQATERAVLLLQYLVDASTDIPEHLLPLNKLLCGLELLDPIETRLDLNEPEQTECDDLLTAVIHHWSALKSTSPDGFRRAFLQRAGILRIYNGNWRLQVERESYDVLLDQLPWNLRVVKLPWMSECLHVEW